MKVKSIKTFRQIPVLSSRCTSSPVGEIKIFFYFYHFLFCLAKVNKQKRKVFNLNKTTKKLKVLTPPSVRISQTTLTMHIQKGYYIPSNSKLSLFNQTEYLREIKNVNKKRFTIHHKYDSKV